MKDVRRFLRMYHSFAFSAVIFLLVIAGSLLGIIPAVKKTLTLRQNTDALLSQTQDLRTKASILASIDETVYRRYLADLVTAVPQDQSLTSMFSTIDGLAAQTGVTITDLGLTKPGSLATESARRQSTEEKQIGSHLLPFSVTVSGSYEQIRDFLARAVSVRRLFRVRGFDLSLIDPTNVEVRMNMDAYFAPYLTTIGSVDTEIDALNEKDEQIIARVATMPLVGEFISMPIEQPNEATGAGKSNPFAP